MGEIKDYLHLYLGCEVIRKNNTDDRTRLTASVLDNCLNTKGGIFSDIKPILRPLSDMTEEERIKCSWQTFNGDTRFWYTIPTIKFLLDKHFDLFDLISEGLAIDKSTLEKAIT